jgi:ankyrin repeat protein
MTALMYAVENNVPGVVQVLLENGANINVEEIELTKKRESDAQEVEEMLRTAQRARNDVAFLRLCAKGTEEDVRQALKFGANVGARDAQRMTTLMYAARDNANPAVMNALMMAAAKFNEKGLWQKGKSKLGFKTADINDGDKEGMTALMYAVENNSPDVVQALLAGGADVNAKDKQDMTVLMRAVVKKSGREMITMLLEAGADANVKNKQGITALMLAVEKSSPEVVQVLLDAEADVNDRDKQGKTVLMFAVERECNPEVVETLLKAGANIDAMDKGGMTALMWAETGKSCSEEVMKLLQTPRRVDTGI